jgi:hypothetical protein
MQDTGISMFAAAASKHGPGVKITEGKQGSVASWGAVGGPSTGSCNEVAFLAPHSSESASDSYTLRLGTVGQWIDMVRTTNAFFGRSHLYIKMMILPRQARDKHRENAFFGVSHCIV